MRSSRRVRTETEYHYWLTIALISVFFFWVLVDSAQAEAVAAIQGSMPDAPSHRFISKGNVSLWVIDGTVKAFDGYVTSRTLNEGGIEHDPIAKPFTHGPVSQGVYFGASLAGDIAFSYLMHKTGHHKIEKIALLIGIGNSASCAGHTAASYRTPSPVTPKNRVPFVKEQL